MVNFPEYLQHKIDERMSSDSLRKLTYVDDMIDFCSNDYLGLAGSQTLYHKIEEAINTSSYKKSGSTGSRLISGNTPHVVKLESKLSYFFNAQSALFFSSGYTTNLAVLSSIPQRGDTIIYDELVHASIKEGMRLSFAKKTSFKHSNLHDLERKLTMIKGQKYVVVEAVYSMDGDICDIERIAVLCEKYNAYLIVDEAHSVGIIGENGQGLCIATAVEQKIFARIYTFGKAAGVHGGCVVGSHSLIQYLINFARPFIYTTASSMHTVLSVDCAIDQIENSSTQRQQLARNITYFREKLKKVNFTNDEQLIESQSAIQGILIPGNTAVKIAALQLQNNKMDVRPILSPTVKAGTERLRICLHSFNTDNEIDRLITCMNNR